MKPTPVPSRKVQHARPCAHCGVVAVHSPATIGSWQRPNPHKSKDIQFPQYENSVLTSLVCAACSKYSILLSTELTSGEHSPFETIVWPQRKQLHVPHPAMPPDVQHDFKEASAIVSASPRGACALLRLALQKICKHLGEPGKNINDDVGALVAAGKVSPEVQMAMDSLRVVGNCAVHPGEIDVDDNPQIAAQLFEWLNFIAEEAIGRPTRIQTLYASLPKTALDAIERRDK